MSQDPYMAAIAAGAAALAKPYRDPDTIGAFVEAFPTIAAARVIEAALPLLRATILSEQAAPGPCPEVTEFGYQDVRADGNDEPRKLRALCDLRAGHAGQHEAYNDDWGTYRWTRTYTQPDIKADTRCRNMLQRTHGDLLICERTSGHPGWHIAGTNVWDGIGEMVLT